MMKSHANLLGEECLSAHSNLLISRRPERSGRSSFFVGTKGWEPNKSIVQKEKMLLICPGQITIIEIRTVNGDG